MEGREFKASLQFRLSFPQVETLAGHMHLPLGAFHFVSKVGRHYPIRFC